MAVRRVKTSRLLGYWGARRGALLAGLFLIVVLVVGSPLMLAAISGTDLPWSRLADVGDAFGGASALLSAMALTGIGASLIVQQRQVRQEFADIDRQQHAELLRLAIDNPELIEVLDADTAARPHARQEIYANLTMMYWLAIWELGEIDDIELRGMAASMFRSEITREWWGRVGAGWIGTANRPDRYRFISIITQELVNTKRDVMVRPSNRGPAAAVVLAAVVAVGAARLARQRSAGGRRRPVRTSSTNARQASAW